MRRLIAAFALLCIASITAVAQTPAKPAPSSHPSASCAVTEATVDSFLKHMFGYDPSIQWQVLNIAPSRATGVTDVSVLLKNPQGQQNVQLYVTPDGKHAVVGDMMPFGADPFAPARNEIAARANGAVRGPANAPVTVVEFSDLQ